MIQATFYHRQRMVVQKGSDIQILPITGILPADIRHQKPIVQKKHCRMATGASLTWRLFSGYPVSTVRVLRPL